MKAFCVIFGCLCFFSSIFGDVEYQENKVYLNSGGVSIQNERIHVMVNGQWQRTKALFSDEKGVYVNEKWCVWECSYCEAINPCTNLVCWRCNR